MPENDEKTPVGGEQPTEEKPVVGPNDSPAKVDDVDDGEDLSEYGVPPMPAEDPEEKKEESPEIDPEKGSDNGSQDGQADKEEIVLPKIPPMEAKPTRLDRRIAKVCVQNLLLQDVKEVPSEEDLLSELAKVPFEKKRAILNGYLAERKRLRGERPSDVNFEEEDIEAMREAERESVRNEILAEEHEKDVMRDFVSFIDGHPELNEKAKEFDPRIANAVETLWRGGMTIRDAFDTVTGSILSVKEGEKKEAEMSKQKILSGSVSATNDLSKSAKAMTWEEFDELRTSDPERYERLLDEGYQPTEG